MFTCDYNKAALESFSMIEAYHQDIESLIEMDELSEGYADDSMYLEASEIESINEAVFGKIVEKIKSFISNNINSIKAFSIAQINKVEKAAKLALAKVKAKTGIGESEELVYFGGWAVLTEGALDSENAKKIKAQFDKAVAEVKSVFSNIYKTVAQKGSSIKEKILSACPTLKKFFSKSSANEMAEIFDIYTEAEFNISAPDISKLVAQAKNTINGIEQSALSAFTSAKTTLSNAAKGANKKFHKFYASAVELLRTASMKAQRLVTENIINKIKSLKK